MNEAEDLVVYRLPHGGEVRGSIESVRVGDREIPRVIEMTQRHLGEPYLRLNVRVEVIDDVPQCRRIELVCEPSGRQIRQVDVREIVVADVVEMMAAVAARRIVERDGQIVSVIEFGRPQPYFDAVRQVRRARASSKRRLTPAFLADVARVYREHFDEAPTDAVAKAFQIRPRTASLYVRKARDAGLLGQTTRGRKGL